MARLGGFRTNRISILGYQRPAGLCSTPSNPRTDATGQHLAGGALGRHQEQPAGVEPVTVLQDRQSGREQDLGEHPGTWRSGRVRHGDRKPKADKKAKGGAKAAQPKKSPASAEKLKGVHGVSRTAQVVAMLNARTAPHGQRSWLRWAGRSIRSARSWPAMKKAGYAVESFQSDKGERTYRINP